MLFNSISFVLLVLFSLIIYYLPILKNRQVLVLIVASLFFYAYNNLTLLLLLFCSIFLNIITSYLVLYNKKINAKCIAVVGVLINIGILAFFKYSPLFAVTFFNTNNGIGSFLIQIPLPIGISFFTFEGISLLIDVFKQKNIDAKKIVPKSFFEHCKNIFLFISFFPHLIAGPILQANEFIPQITPKYVKNIHWQKSIKKLILGYFLKMVIADNLKDYTIGIVFPEFQFYSSNTLLAMLLGYSCQIFADFAGYSLIAIGIAELYGYSLLENFNFPYISSSFKEFWKRWHISLSAFLMRYLYFSLGGNKKGKIKTYINLMITMLIGGIWHGAAWSYAVWGGFHGLALGLERLTNDIFKIEIKHKLWIFFKRIFIFICISFAWLLFKLPNFNEAVLYISSITKNNHLASKMHIIANIILYSFPIFLFHLIYLLKQTNWKFIIAKYEFILYGLLLFLILTNSGTSGTFIYFQF